MVAWMKPKNNAFTLRREEPVLLPIEQERGIRKKDAVRRVCRTDKKGATLVEVMFALLILAILVVVVPRLVEHPRRLVVNAVWKQMAVGAANEVLEEAVSLGYAKVDSVDIDAITGSYAMNARTLDGTLLVTAHGTGSQNDPYYKEVAVTVTVPDGNDSVTLETLIFEE
ncbi:prepilin-type N-terminal cleavage/methylation domain-containing protein [Pontiellaceae bacterium B1224]|nr:prepilin-type N-terminal cleavage/methylation domain-containing protein [Pontiellaceae bacterium B1224]